MEESRIIEVKQDILSHNTHEADAFRAQLAKKDTLYTDIMASPGGGKTTLLLALIRQLRNDAAAQGVQEPGIGVIEADLASDVDAQKIKKAGVVSVELNTKSICHVDMGMVKSAYRAFDTLSDNFDYLFLENIGNLVCPADFDTGAHVRIMLLSVPEGWDKVMKYPPMFSIVDALVVTKCDYLPLNPDFDMAALKKQARALNPNLEIFEVSAKTGEGIDGLTAWVRSRRDVGLA